MYELNIIDVPNQEFYTVLNDQACLIQLRQLGKFLYLSLSVEQETVIEGAICLSGQFVIQKKHTGFNGDFVLIDTKAPPDKQAQGYWQGLGERFKLYYLTDEEVKIVINRNLQSINEKALSAL